MNAPATKPAAPFAAPAQLLARPSLVTKFAARYTIDADKLLPILKATAFKQRDGEVSNEQMAALLVVADQYGLNPFTREIFAFPDKQNGIVPVVGVDGWSRIINDHPQSDGFEFRQSDAFADELPGAKPCPAWMEVVIYRKDRAHPIVVREYLDEVYRAPFKRTDGSTVNGPWQTHTKRFLRHKTLIQGARIAYGFSGIYDEDEAERIIERDVTPARPWEAQPTQLTGAEALKAAVGKARSTSAAQHGAPPGATATSPDDDPTLDIPGAGDISHVGKDSGAPTVDYEALLKRLQSGTSLDALDADASLIGAVEGPDRQNRLAKAYQARRADLGGKRK